MDPLPAYRYGSARTLVRLHGEYLQACLEVWQNAKALRIVLPETDDPSYVSMETLLAHVLGAAAHYMKWMCAKLELVDPAIRPTPGLNAIGAEAEGYLAHLIDRWRLPLSEIEEERFNRPEFRSGWGVNYCIDAMLEHALVHPVLHRVQLEELADEQSVA